MPLISLEISDEELRAIQAANNGAYQSDAAFIRAVLGPMVRAWVEDDRKRWRRRILEVFEAADERATKRQILTAIEEGQG